MASAVLQFPMERGERQLWAGAPRQGVALRQTDLFMVPFSLLWGGFAVFWEAMALRTGGPSFFPVFGVPFVAAGLYITVGRFFVDARRRARTTYLVTSNRVVVIGGVFTPQTKSLMLTTLSDVSMTERPDGSGTITFGALNPIFAMYAGMSWPGVPQVPSFEMIPDVRGVYGIIQAAQQDALAHRST
jgi:hypothetical protein